MEFIDNFRNETYAKELVKELQNITKENINIMEVCGTHTMAIFKYGIREILPDNIKLISGPGCPVCVTPQSYIDAAIELSERKDVVIATFGDMMKVPGRKTSLLKRKAEGAHIHVVYSPMDTIAISKENPFKKVVFLSVGFETTTPMAAVTLLEAKKYGVNNLYYLTANKIVTSVIESLIMDESLNINGFILPGNVSAIIGEKPYQFLSEKYNIPGVIMGFEPIEILKGLVSLVKMIAEKDYKIVNEYKQIVSYDGNQKALNYIDKVFKKVDSRWRGIGVIKSSGYDLNEQYELYNAARQFNIKYDDYEDKTGCRCGEILKGKISPIECPLFKKICTPENPIGSCMVSAEGTCAAYYTYRR